MKLPHARKINLMALATPLAIFIVCPSALAQSEKRGSDVVSVPATRVIDGDYFAFGRLIQISGTVNGDLYAFGGQVIVDGKVNGDLIVAGGAVTISGGIAQDARVTGGQIDVNGSIGRNLTLAGGNVGLARTASVRGNVLAAGGNLHVASPIGGSARFGAGNLILSSRIGGDVNAAVGMLRIASTADIQGNVHYRSGEIASVDQGAVIRGKLVRTTPPKLPVTSSDIFVFFAAAIAFLVIVSVVSTLILGLLSVRFLPNYHHAAVSILRERPWASLGIGIIAAIVTPVACAALFATVLGIPIAIILMVSYLILLYFGRIFVMSLIGVAILGNRAHTRPGSAFVLGLIVYYVIALIPFLGWLVVLLAILFGLGAELITRKDFYVTARREAMI